MQMEEPDTDHLDLEGLRNLLEKEREPCLTILLPTHRKGKETRQDPIRLNNLTGEAAEILSGRGLDREDVERFIEPLRALVADTGFWLHQGDGLALFRTAEFFERYRLPVSLDEIAEVGIHFYVQPVLPAVVGDGEFFVLALSQEESRLLRGTRHEFETVEVEDVPERPSDIVGPGLIKSVQFHTGTGSGVEGGHRAAIFHGHGAAGDDAQAKKDLLKFFQRLDEAIGETIRGTEAPLVLAGVDSVRSLYREASDYPHLLEEGVDGNPDKMSSRDIHARAWEIAAPLFERDQKEAEELFKHLAGTDDRRARLGVKQMVPAAVNRRVETLFVARDREAWGRYDPERNEVDLHQERKDGDTQLLNLAVVFTLRNGGSVYSITKERMPGNGLAAAVLFG